MSTFEPIHVFPILGTLLTALCMWGAMRSLRLRRLLMDTPTSKAISVFLGLVELKGTAETEQPIIATLSESKCVHYSWSVQERWSRTVTESYTDSNGKRRTRTRRQSGWTTVASGSEAIPFYLRDETGAVRIIPDGAKIEPMTTFNQSCGRGDPLYYAKGPRTAVSHSDHIRAFAEQSIPLHTPLYIMGSAREREDIVAAEIAHDPSVSIYLISTRCEDTIRRGKTIAQWCFMIVAGLLLIAGWITPYYIAHEQIHLPTLIMATGGFGLLWMIGWFLTVYNSIARLHQRVSRAWSNIDVELNRRHDLIPQLVSVVTGYRDHEQKAQQEITHLRSQIHATAPGESGPDPEAITPDLMALAEAYPDLKAGDRFLALQEQIVETEERIALARSYYNEIASHFNTRIVVVPDCYVARVGGFESHPLMQASGFERAPVVVKFAD